ncbi:MAG: hypothetical protein AAGA56_27465 [Myxococcota bacterium]
MKKKQFLAGAVFGGLAIHFAVAACVTAMDSSDDDDSGTEASTSSNIASSGSLSTASAQTPNDCLEWQIQAKAITATDVTISVFPGWEPFAGGGNGLYFIRRCAD